MKVNKIYDKLFQPSLRGSTVRYHLLGTPSFGSGLHRSMYCCLSLCGELGPPIQESGAIISLWISPLSLSLSFSSRQLVQSRHSHAMTWTWTFIPIHIRTHALHVCQANLGRSSHQFTCGVKLPNRTFGYFHASTLLFLSKVFLDFQENFDQKNVRKKLFLLCINAWKT